MFYRNEWSSEYGARTTTLRSECVEIMMIGVWWYVGE